MVPPNNGCVEAEQKEILFKGVNIHRVSADNPYTLCTAFNGRNI